MQPHAGYLDLDGKTIRFDEAKCRLCDGLLHAEAAADRGTLKLYGIPFPAASAPEELAGQACEVEDPRSDPVAEGGFETRKYLFAWQALVVRCGRFNAAKRLLPISFEGEVEDYESGRQCSAEGQIIAVVDDEWSP